MNWVKGAQAYIDAGLSVVPIPKMWDDPAHKNYKYQWGAYQHYKMDAATVEKEFRKAEGMAIVCGAISGNLVVIDFDSMAAWEQWRAEAEEFTAIWDKLTIEKSQQGMHVYVRVALPECPRNEKWAEIERDKARYTAIETRGEGGLIFCAPTPGYEWVQGDWRTIQTISDDEFGLLEALARQQDDYKQKRTEKFERVEHAPNSEGNRPGDVFNRDVQWDEMFTLMGAKVSHQNSRRIYITRPGKKAGASGSTGNGSKGQDLFYCFSSNWHPFEMRCCYSKFAIWTMLEHGGDYKKSAKAAAERFGLVREVQQSVSIRDRLKAVDGGRAEITSEARKPDKVETWEASDAGNAEQFVQYADGKLLYCHQWGRWIAWDGKRWVTDDVSTVSAQSLYLEMIAPLKYSDPKWYEKCRSSARIDSTLKVARSCPQLSCRPEDFDRDPWILNMQSGVALLVTGDIVPHDPKYRCSRITRVGHDCTEEDMAFITQFLQSICTGKEDQYEALQRFVGYSCTGSTKAQKFLLGVGKGRNGKSTLTNLMHYALGDYAGSMDSRLLLSSKSERPLYELETLRGKRFVKCEEPDRRRPMDAEFLKKIISAEPMMVAAKYGHPYEIEPTFKLWLLANHKPRVDFDYAFERRTLVMPFELDMPDSQVDETLPDKLRKAAGAFLLWAIAGACQFAQEGLIQTDAMKAELASYREDNDFMQRFLDERVIEEVDAYIESAALFTAYIEWARRTNSPHLTQGEFTGRMKIKGYGTERVGKQGRKGYRNMRLKDSAFDE